MPNAASLLRYLLLFSMLASPVAFAQDEADTPFPQAEESNQLNGWDRLIYVPFKELRKVFDSQDASAVIPY